MFDAHPPDHRHPQSNNHVSSRENLVNKNKEGMFGSRHPELSGCITTHTVRNTP